MSGDPERLIEALEQAVQANPGLAALRTHLADLLLETGRAEQALGHYRAALDQEPQGEGIRLGMVRAYLAMGKAEVALVILEELLRSEPASRQALELAAQAYQAAGEADKAAWALRQLGEQQPKTAVEKPPQSGRERQQVAVPAQDAGEGFKAELERSQITFKDVGGMEELKDEIRLKIIHPLTHPEIYRAYGKRPGGGILMYGPPGCGKTYLARATAGEVQAHFLVIGLHDVLDMYLGQSEQNLHHAFELARANTPCVLFFDEVDALGASRTDMRYSAGRQVINQFLSELDGVNTANEGVLVLAATNAPWHLDPALRRPGRFDRVIFVPPPDAEARAAILEIHLAGKPAERIDFKKLAKESDGFSGADLKGLVDAAVERKLEEAMRSGTTLPLSSKDLLEAAKKIKPTVREWFSTARNYALYANQSGLYDEVLEYIQSRSSEYPDLLSLFFSRGRK